MQRLAIATGILVVASLAACSLLFPISDDAASGRVGHLPDSNVEGDAESGAGDVDGASAAEASTRHCEQTGRGPELVNAGDRLCIDATEVTQRHYAAFLDAGVAKDSQIEGCEENTSFAPAGGLAADGGNLPVHGVDWCDAVAFCAWAGKKICGTLPGVELPPVDAGPDAGFVHGFTFGDAVDRNVSATAFACQGGDAGRVYPYGNDFDPNACYGKSGLAGNVEIGPVASKPCEGGFPGLFDLVGNVTEWVDACENQACAATSAAECRSFGLYPRISDPIGYDIRTPVGIRCCGVAPPVP